MKVKVRHNQTLLDIAIQTLGDISGVFLLAELNDLEITQDLKTGMELVFPGTLENKRIVKSYVEKALIPATAISPDLSGNDGVLLEGIEFWGIEYDFIVSGEAGVVS